jgi:hypothetical protein
MRLRAASSAVEKELRRFSLRSQAAGGGGGAEPDGGDAESGEGEQEQDGDGRCAELSLFEGAEGGGRGIGCEFRDGAAASGGDEVERPRADGEAKGRDGGTGGAVGDGGCRDSDSAGEGDAEEMSEQEVPGLGSIEPAAVRMPEGQRGEAGDPRERPAGDQRERFGEEEQRHTGRRLEHELPRAARALAGDEADRDEGEEQRDGDVVGAEGGDEDAVERRESLGEGGGASPDAAGLGVGLDGGDEAVAGEGADHEQEEPKGSGGEEFA